MTKVIAVAALFCLPFCCFAQRNSVADLQKKYKDDNVFSISVNGEKKKQILQVLAVSSASKGYSSQDIKRLKKEISKQPFEELFSVKNATGQLQLHIAEKNGKPSKWVMIIDNESDGFITMDFSGDE